MEVLNSNNFPFKPNERDCKQYFLTVSDYYLKAIKYAEKTFQNKGFLTAKSIGVIGAGNQIVVITNLLARNLISNDEVACIFSFPGRQQTSTKKTIVRVKKMRGYWKRVSLFLCFSKGTGEFPVMARRIFSEANKNKKIEALKIYALNLNNGEIKELWRNDKKIAHNKEKEE